MEENEDQTSLVEQTMEDFLDLPSSLQVDILVDFVRTTYGDRESSRLFELYMLDRQKRPDGDASVPHLS